VPQKGKAMLNRKDALITGINRIFLEALTCETEAQLGRICLSVTQMLTCSPFGYVFVLDEHMTLCELAVGDPQAVECPSKATPDATQDDITGATELIHRVLKGAFYTNHPHPDLSGVPEKVHAFMGVPLISNERTIGVLAVANRQGGYTPEDLQSLSDLAGAVVQAIVHKRTEAALAAELANNKRLQEISACLIHAGNVDALLSDILMAAIDFMNADAGHLQLYDAEEGKLRVLAQHGFTPSLLASLTHGKQGERASYVTALESGRRIVIPDIETSAVFAAGPLPRIKLEAGLRAVQATPLISRAGLVLGVISTYWRATHEPGHRELRFLDMLARQAADVIERQMNQNAILKSHEQLEKRVVERTVELEIRARQLQRLALELSRTEEKEQERIAEILHEDLQQYLSALKYRLWNLLPEERLDPELKRKIEDLENLINESIQKTRRLSHELNPPVLRQNGLMAGLKWLITEMKEKHGLSVSLSTRGEVNPESSTIASVLFRAVRELLLNIVKHAATDTAMVEARREGKWMRLIVTDNGIGFAPEDCVIEKANAGFGLFGLTERIGYLGGRVEIQSAPGKGCRVVLTVDASMPTRTTSPAFAPVPVPAAAPARKSGKGKIRILLVDDHTIMREGLANLFKGKEEFEVTAQAANGQEAVRLAAELDPDIILMDISMPVMDGIEATTLISRSQPAVRIIGLSMHDDDSTKERMLAAGAAGYIYKAAPAGKLIEAIRQVHASGRQDRNP
jgi:signal transduction histidine kinase/ActR/RegA family two-component response regulator